MSKKRFLLMFIVVLCMLSTTVMGATINVNWDGTGDYTTIQAGINAATSGVDTVEVSPGTYTENINFNNKDIILTSTDPDDPDVVDATIIDGDESGSVVTFSGSETDDCELIGFTITGGSGTLYNYNLYGGGGIFGNDTLAEISRCVFVDNHVTGTNASFGGAINQLDGTIDRCTFTDNSSIAGAASGYGGALFSCGGTISNCLFYDNEAQQGGALFVCNGDIINCTIADNVATTGSGLRVCSGTITNCIIWGNTMNNCATPTYSCFSGGTGTNIDDDPEFVDAANGDYRSSSENSPCVDSGYNNVVPEDYDYDIIGNDRIIDGDGDETDTVDMGAYEFLPLVHNINQDIWYSAISAAIDVASTDDVIVVSPGTYYENIDFGGNDITLKSTDPDDPSVVAATIIDGDESGSVVTFGGSETSACKLIGFTITKGSGTEVGNGLYYGGGIYGNSTLAEISRCVFVDNYVTCVISNCFGGAIYQLDGTIDRCTFTNNSSIGAGGEGFGGALNSCGGTISNCLFSGNGAGQYGGALFGCAGTISNCLFYDNEAGDYGGGLAYCGGDIINCTIADNVATTGSGLIGCYGTVTNCIIWGNNIDGGTPPTYSCFSNAVEDEIDFNINDDPDFADAANGDYRITKNSPCVNSGDNSVVTEDYDIVGNDRIIYGRVDMGAYELPRMIYVDGDLTTGANNGLSWANAFKYLQDALTMAREVGVEQIWIANGTYYPDVWEAQNDPSGNNVKEESFALVDGVKIYGGFQGISPAFPDGEDEISDRDEDTSENLTILSGDIDEVGGNSGNSYNVVTASGTSSLTLLDRVKICDGNASGTYANSDGGGMIVNNGNLKVVDCSFFYNNAANRGGAVYNNFSSPTFIRCRFEDNAALFGGAMFNYYKSNPIIRDCDLVGNEAENGGAIMNHSESSPTISRCAIVDNESVGDGGGIANTQISSPKIDNCAISNNTAGNDGGGVLDSYYCNTEIQNCTIAFNTSANTSGCGLIHNEVTDDPSQTTIYNSIIWNNDDGTFAYSFDMQYYPSAAYISEYNCVNGIVENDGNINNDPCFLDSSGNVNRMHSDYLYLKTDPVSPCINAGLNGYVPTSSIADIAFFERIQGGTVDMGAYEVGDTVFDYTVIVSVCIVNESNSSYNTSDLTSYNNYLGTLDDDIIVIDAIWKPYDPSYPTLDYLGDPLPDTIEFVEISQFPTENELLAEYQSIINDLPDSVDYVIFSVDNSGSMYLTEIWSNQNEYDSFVWNIGSSIVDTEYNELIMLNGENWLKELEARLTSLVQEKGL